MMYEFDNLIHSSHHSLKISIVYTKKKNMFDYGDGDQLATEYADS